MKSFTKFCLLVFLSFLFVSVSKAEAATLFFSPASGTYQVENSFSVAVSVSDDAQSINAVSGTISFPNDKLSVESIAKAGSIVNLWVQDPIFSNQNGTIKFEGVVLNPGFIGKSGTIFVITFHVKAPGESTIRFSSGSVLANDGKATDVLDNLGVATFYLKRPDQALLPSVKNQIAGAVGTVETKILISPVITSWPSQLDYDQNLIIKGSTKYPNSQVIIWLSRDGKEPESDYTKTDANGNFLFAKTGGLNDGAYNMWAEVADDLGNKSNPSEEVSFVVKPSIMKRIVSFTTDICSLLVPLVALFILLLTIIFYGWRKFRNFKTGVHDKAVNAENAFEKMFERIEDMHRKQKDQLLNAKGKRPLTAEEESILHQLENSMTEVKNSIEKKIDDIIS